MEGQDLARADEENNIVNYFFCAAIFLITVLCAIYGGIDYDVHISVCPKLSDALHPFVYFSKNCEPLWHVLTKVVHRIFFIPVDWAAYIVSGLCNAILYEIIRKYLSPHCKHAQLAVFALLLAGPLYLPWYNKNIYLGQSSPNIWHNPTLIMAKRFALSAMIVAMRVMQTTVSFKDCSSCKKDLLLLTGLLFFSALAKPAFVQVFFPAIFVWCVVKVLVSKGKYFSTALILFFCCLPAFFVLLSQFFLCFLISGASAESGPSIGVKLFYVMKIHSPNVFLSPLLTIAFPICVLALSFVQRQKLLDSTKFSWLMYLFSFLFAALLYEPARPSHGNFGWGMAIAIMVLWVESAKNFLVMKKNSARIAMELKIFVVSRFLCKMADVILCFHILFGVIYLYRIVFLRNIE
ncbi:MAG: hypothetical protein IK015_00530 [Treponema sp.]|nr:hypothetical protein [Treponema sp.]